MSGGAHTPPRPPVVGHLPRLANDPLRLLTAVQDTYGGREPLVRLDASAGPSVSAVLDAELVHEILADRERFARPDFAPGTEQRKGLLSSDGRLWEQQRSVLEPEFVGASLGEYAEIASEKTTEMLAGWPAHGEIDLYRELSTLTMRVITQSLFSQDTTPERAREVYEALDVTSAEFESDPGDFLLPDFLQSGPSDAFRDADATLEAAAEAFVDDHRNRQDPPTDMITALIEAEADPSVELSDNELVDEAILFMTAGQETTALTITYAFHWLSQHPDARRRVTEEAQEVLGGDPPGWDDLPELSFTERVVRETLRLTPAAWNIARLAREPTTVAGTHLAADDQLLLCPYAHHRDRNVWRAPTEFRPDRWDGEVSRSIDSYFPFGSGPRVCIGRQIALTEAQFALAHVLQQYDVGVHTDRLDLQPSITLRPRTAMTATVDARS